MYNTDKYINKIQKNSDLLRCFIAIPIESVIQKQISNLQKQLLINVPTLTLVKPQNIHITLIFIGNINTIQIEQTKALLTECSNNFKNFNLKFEGLGAFPNIHTAKVIWIGIAAQNNTIFELQNFLEEKLLKQNMINKKERFTPHITIARNKQHQAYNPIYKYLQKHKDTVLGQYTINTITLNSSILTATGPIYSTLYQIHL